VFLEPSCLSAVKEDAPALVRLEYRAKAEAVAEACVLFDELASTLDLPLKAGPKKILLHGHCHQKSMGKLDATKKLLAKIPGASVTDLDAGCCGMAGSFGYGTEHYDISVAIANRKLGRIGSTGHIVQAPSGGSGRGGRSASGGAVAEALRLGL
jgi:Fe-S oxidoreductase